MRIKNSKFIHKVPKQNSEYLWDRQTVSWDPEKILYVSIPSKGLDEKNTIEQIPLYFWT